MRSKLSPAVKVCRKEKLWSKGGLNEESPQTTSNANRVAELSTRLMLMALAGRAGTRSEAAATAAKQWLLNELRDTEGA